MRRASGGSLFRQKARQKPSTRKACKSSHFRLANRGDFNLHFTAIVLQVIINFFV